MLAEIDEHARRLSTSRIAVLIGAIATDSLVDAIVVGATSSAELRQITDAVASQVATDLRLAALPEKLLDPRRWAR